MTQATESDKARQYIETLSLAVEEGYDSLEHELFHQTVAARTRHPCQPFSRKISFEDAVQTVTLPDDERDLVTHLSALQDRFDAQRDVLDEMVHGTGGADSP